MRSNVRARGPQQTLIDELVSVILMDKSPQLFESLIGQRSRHRSMLCGQPQVPASSGRDHLGVIKFPEFRLSKIAHIALR